MRPLLVLGALGIAFAGCGGSSTALTPGGPDATTEAGVADGPNPVDVTGNEATARDAPSQADAPLQADAPSQQDSPTGSDAPSQVDSGQADAVAGDSGGGPCIPPDASADICPQRGLQCCSNVCVDELNDPFNCGGCNQPCAAPTSMCNNGSCVVPDCVPACGATQTCCEIIGPGPTGLSQCVDGPACPVGCPLCG